MLGFSHLGLALAALYAAAAPSEASSAPASAPPATEGCELHVWPTSNYGGTFFHANVRYGGYDLVSSEVPLAADKAHRGFGADRQIEFLVDSIKRSGKFDGYTIVVHEPLPQERAYANLLDETIGAGKRQIVSSAPCYAEFHITFLTVFRSTLTKMLMTGFIVRYFPADPNGDAIRIIHSRLTRGEERVGLSPFDFSTATLTSEERGALAGSFRFMADRFLRKKVTAQPDKAEPR